MGRLDRIIRAAIAIAFGLLILADTVTGTFAVILAILAVVLVLTSAISFCPLYSLFGIHTGRKTK